MKTSSLVCLVALLAIPTTALCEQLEDAVSEDTASGSPGANFFEAKVRPVLVEHCYECHSARSETAEGGLRLDHRAAIRQGGDRGPAIVPGRPEASLLLTAILHRDVDLKMPPEQPRLPAAIIADLRKWIEIGAPDPRDSDGVDSQTAIAKATDHWAYRTVAVSPTPAGANRLWPRSSADHFVLVTLEQNGLSPSVDAAPRVLLRRLYFDLVGLPPSPEATVRFVAAVEKDGMDQALAREVDDLLKLPAFGERWGRHWLDVARYGESSGKEANISFPYAWRYRDYVIDSVNADIPFDQFITEQIAGDLLDYDSAAERARLLVATGFLAIGTKNLSENNLLQFQADIIDEQIDALTRAVMASSVACARCHHHKFDPFSMEDYYGLAGIFASTKTFFGTFTSPANNRGGEPLPLPRVDGQQLFHKSLGPKKFRELKGNLAALNAEWAEMEAAKNAGLAGEEPERAFTLREILANIWRRGPVAGKLATLDDTGKALPLAMGTLDSNEIIDVPLLARGEVGRPGEIVPRALPRALRVDSYEAMPSDESGRKELAAWLTDAKHPLTSRVFVNRVWHHLFGAGLVRTVDNFGTTGESPSHLKLLDNLAREFVQDNWSLKRLVRRLVLSRSYRQASTFDAGKFQQDPDNRLLWRMPKRRLEAEPIRDAMLAVSDELNLSRPGGSLVATGIGDRPISLIGLSKKLPRDLDGSFHRSVYLPAIRDRLPDVLEIFDFAEPSLVTGIRDTTNVPLQALYLLNSQFVLDRASALAARLLREVETTEEVALRSFQLCFNREPDSRELPRALEFLDTDGDDAETRSLALVSFCQALLSTAEFRNLD